MNLYINILLQRAYEQVEINFSNSLIIHAALTQPDHLILVRWMGLEIHALFRNNFKHGCKFLNLHIDKARKTNDDKQVYLITHFTKQNLNLN